MGHGLLHLLSRLEHFLASLCCFCPRTTLTSNCAQTFLSLGSLCHTQQNVPPGHPEGRLCFMPCTSRGALPSIRPVRRLVAFFSFFPGSGSHEKPRHDDKLPSALSYLQDCCINQIKSQPVRCVSAGFYTAHRELQPDQLNEETFSSKSAKILRSRVHSALQRG
jgi:hypothetical protein